MNKFINEVLTTKINKHYDLIVAGGGPSGCGAAIAAGRQGLKTLVVERANCVGGMWTSGFVNPLFDQENKESGIIHEIVTELKKRNAWGGFWGITFQYEPMKNILDTMLIEAGVDILFDTVVCKAITEENTVKGVVIENKDGRSAFTSDFVIDCTGDADVIASAGGTFSIGREKDNQCQSITLMFTIGNVDFMQENEHTLFNMYLKAKNNCNSDYVLPFNAPYLIKVPNSTTAVVQLTHMRNLNPLSAYDRSRAMIVGRKQAMEAVQFMKECIPQFKNIELLQTAPMLGVRETRRIVGEYTLSYQDISVGKSFYDGITNVSFGIDIHSPDEDVQECMPVKTYQIPYRCLIPKGLNNILAAGRCISGTHEAMASYRVTGNCVAMGEAAGLACSVALKANKNLRDVTVGEMFVQCENPSE